MSLSRKEKGKALFVELGKKTNAKDRRTTPCQVRITEMMQKKKPRRQE